MSDVAINLENVSVRYQVASQPIKTFKEYLIQRVRRSVKFESFWALRDVNLQVHQGEVFGVVGHNGAGKSTMLKLVARVLHPSSGRVWVRGQVSPLLHFGAGFHPELTGRENVFLHGTLLGFTRREMEAKFDRIVQFAELEEFIDAPLRTYSTGMTARLGFAVTTDVEPNILLVDEVMSVGDERFQQKSYARMEAFRQGGATIVLVSHSMALVEQLCQRVAWIDHGELKAIGPPAEVIAAYRASQIG